MVSSIPWYESGDKSHGRRSEKIYIWFRVQAIQRCTADANFETWLFLRLDKPDFRHSLLELFYVSIDGALKFNRQPLSFSQVLGCE